MGDVFDRWRLNNGWNPWDDDTQMAAIASFVHSLDREDIPATAYGELYERVLATRAKALENGKQIPQFGADLMLACWPPLRKELREREVARGRTLEANAEAACEMCYGSGFKVIDDGNGYTHSEKCDHSKE